MGLLKESSTGNEGVGPGERVLTYLALNRRQAILSFLPPSVSSFTVCRDRPLFGPSQELEYKRTETYLLSAYEAK